MVRPPELDGRRRADIRNAIVERAPYYLESWDPAADGAGGALVDLFAELASDLTERVDQLPRKHRTQLYADLGFTRQPPQPATVPVSFSIEPDASDPVSIPADTVLEADEEHFRIGTEHAFEATPARIDAMYRTDPSTDRVVDHLGTVGGGEATSCFVGEDIQEHHCYIGDPEWLAVTPHSTIAINIRPNDAEPLDATWEYFAERDGTNQWVAFAEEHTSWSDGTLELIPTEALVETTINRIESYWIRCVLPNDKDPNNVQMAMTDLSFQGVRNDATIDALYANDVPKAPDDGEIEIFGAVPQLRDAFYIASENAFTKTGSEVSLTLSTSGESLIGEEFTLSWEYFDGNAWAVLPELAIEGDDELAVTFEVPEDIESTAVAGTEGVWIRVRLVGGTHIQEQFTRSGSSLEDSPVLSDLEGTYEYTSGASPSDVFRWNALAYDRPSFDGETDVPLFEPLEDDVQSLYIGFDRTLDGGPYQLYLDLIDRAYPDWFSPRVRWEYFAGEDGWRPATVTDGTEGLTRAGIIRFSFDPPTRSSERFGEDRHWVRARVRGDGFVSGNPGETSVSVQHRKSRVPIDPRPSGERRPHLEPWRACRATLETDHGAGTDEGFAPVCSGIYQNTTLAKHVDNVEERLGSSDGRPSQSFSLARPPVIEHELWVEESATITDEELAQLETKQPSDVNVEWDRDGQVSTAWIRWSSVTDLDASGPTDRHYTIDLVDGDVDFGDGDHGRIPPTGDENLRVHYRTGGGSTGNVGPGAIDDLTEPITHVEEVTNPIESGGGSDEETTASVRERAPARLRTRGRAVTATDYEHLALDAARELASVRCIRDMNEAGERASGWVTVLLVPADSSDPPEPSVALLDRVTSALAEQAPHHVIARDRLVVRGPTYIPATVTGTIVVEDVESQSAFEATVREDLRTFLHPLHGNHGDGWSFGELPTISSVIAVIERLSPVDHVPDIRLQYGDNAAITPGDAPPHVSPDVLITSGTHELEIRVAGQEGS